VDNTDATENAEGYRNFFITRGKLHSVYFIAQLSDPHNFIIIFDRNAQNVPDTRQKIRATDKTGSVNLPSDKPSGLVHSLVEKGMRVRIADVEQFSGHGNVASNALIFGNSNFWDGLLMTK
jgi:hypothetical protein